MGFSVVDPDDGVLESHNGGLRKVLYWV
jgi:hypothetical protein